MKNSFVVESIAAVGVAAKLASRLREFLRLLGFKFPSRQNRSARISKVNPRALSE